MFAGRLAPGPYTRAALIRIGLFVGATVAFPFVLYGIAQLSNCRSVGGACGAVGLVVAMFGKPPIYLIFIASFVGITVRRLRDMGLPVAFAVVVPVLMLADFSFGVTMGAPWSLGFVLGAMGGWPRDLTAALICIAFLCVMPSSPNSTEPRHWGYTGTLALGLVIVLTMGAVLSLVRGLQLWFANFNGVLFTQSILKYYNLYGIFALILFLVLLGMVAWQQWQRS